MQPPYSITDSAAEFAALTAGHGRHAVAKIVTVTHRIRLVGLLIASHRIRLVDVLEILIRISGA